MTSDAALISGALRNLAEFSGLGRRRDDLRPRLSSHPAGQHVVLCRVSDDEVVVTRIVHDRRDVEYEPGP